ncbi:MAG: B12-binding domain-containing protein [Sphingomonadaceae bacterium]
MASLFGVDSNGSQAASPSYREPEPRRSRPSHDPLDKLIELEVIPRLLVAHSGPRDRRVASDGDAVISAADIERATDMSLALDAEMLLAEMEILLRRGIPVESLFIDLLAPVARRLGTLWEEDRVDFVAVTMGLWRLQEVLHEIAARTPRIVAAFSASRDGLFTALPGEQHSFGATMVEECFARAGWETLLLLDVSRRGLLDRVAGRPFDLIGLTVSCDCEVDELRALIAALRKVSKNSSVRIMIGGRVPNADPSLAQQVGADATALTATAAVAVADRLVDASRQAVSV